VVLLLKRDLVSWSLAIDEYGGHEDLRGSGHRSVIPYIHGRMELYCSSLPCVSLFSDRPCEVAHARAFYSSTSCSYIETRDTIGWHNGAGHVQYSRVADDKIRHTHVVEDIICYSYPLGPWMLYRVSTTSGHLSDPVSQCNCITLSYKWLGQAPLHRGGQKKAQAGHA
jgi:hypothetical protein